jgi:uncharacterized repeat protein (TIGR02543 family)
VNVKLFEWKHSAGILSALFLLSSLGIASPARANGTYDPGSGNGTVACSVSGFFTVSQHHVISNSNCSGNAHIPDEVVTIGANAFGGAWQLTSVSIPAMVDRINASAFYASNLQGGVTFRSGPRNFSYVDIGNFAFSSTSFSSIVLPAVGNISSTAFEGNNALTDIYFLGNTSGPPSAQGGNVQYPCHFCNLGIDPVAHVRPTSAGWPAEGTYWKRAPDYYNNLRGGLLVNYGIFDITYDSNGGSPVDVGVLLDGIPIAQPSSPTRSGYTFMGWSATEDGDVLSFPYTPEVISDLSLHAKWTANVYTLTYTYNSATGGNISTSETFSTGGTAITLPTPTRAGYTFAGWYSNAELTSKIGDAGASYSPTGETLTLSAYARWEADSTSKPDKFSVSTKKVYVAKSLASKVGVKTVSPKATVTFSIAKSSNKVCTTSGSKVKILKAGKCVITFTVQEPKSKKGKKPKAKKIVKILIVK